MPIYTDKIRSVLTRFEGAQQVTGYIPCNKKSGGTANYKGGPNPDNYVPMGISGVTIATGVDLGQTSAAALLKMGVRQTTVNDLKVYLGKQKFEAVKVLHEFPLTVSLSVANELDECMHKYHIGIIRDRYDRDAGKGTFETLPWQAQAVIVSILYQRGVGSPSKFLGTWNVLVSQKWADAAKRFQNPALWNGYQSRRTAEGKILEELA